MNHRNLAEWIPGIHVVCPNPVRFVEDSGTLHYFGLPSNLAVFEGTNKTLYRRPVMSCEEERADLGRRLAEIVAKAKAKLDDMERRILDEFEQDRKQRNRPSEIPSGRSSMSMASRSVLDPSAFSGPITYTKAALAEIAQTITNLRQRLEPSTITEEERWLEESHCRALADAALRALEQTS